MKPLLAFCLFIWVATSCNKDHTPDTPPVVTLPGSTHVPSSQKGITSFAFTAADNTFLTSDVNGSIGTDTISVVMPQGTVVIRLKPSIVFTGITVTPAAEQEQDFSQPVRYTVMAEDSSLKVYIVKVTVPKVPSAVVYGCGSQSTISSGYLYAINADDGSIIWSIATYANSSTPTYHNGILFFFANQTLRAVSAASGAEVWHFTTPDYGYPPLVWNGKVYFQDDDMKVYCLDEVSGSLQWTFDEGEKTPGNYGVPTIVDGVLYAGSYNTHLFALNPVTGSLVWEHTSFDGAPYFSPCVANGIVYTGDYLYFTAFKATDGTPLWTSRNFGYIHEIATGGGRIYAGSSDDRVHALDAITGAEQWDFPTPHMVERAPVYSGDTLFASSYNILYALDAKTGSQLWRTDTDEDINGSTYCKGNLYTGGYERMLSVNTKTGALNWQFAPIGTHEDFHPVCVVDSSGQVYESSSSGAVN